MTIFTYLLVLAKISKNKVFPGVWQSRSQSPRSLVERPTSPSCPLQPLDKGNEDSGNEIGRLGDP